ncbi:uncharacterized protein LOC133330910 [Musca vetustissima]|uniref:uncharacterized protein LOC133330910 n=1 Tax=Musca vetustissima TaxID=27455 RepID=UPI002AB79B4F|nr:uncharacterized protein LOC133330910 [Musca vetustissima]
MLNRFSVWAALILSILLLVVVVVLAVRGTSCSGLNNCDPFKAVCASAKNEHQFFYSQCDMIRDSCLTGKDWKRDNFSHCNVHI